jgi:pyridoxal 5'-phosphate synthase pdxT subunit
MKVGVVSIQGDFEKHLQSLQRIGAPAKEVRTPEDLEGVARLILPGGESTAVGLLMQRFGLGEAIQAKAKQGMPIWGTCMGMILMATDIEDRPDQYSLKLLDVTVKRNAFGYQVHSFEDAVPMEGLDEDVLGVFIRAPILTRLGPDVQALAHYDGKVVAARQGNLLGTSFHPELTEDTRLHEWFVDW